MSLRKYSFARKVSRAIIGTALCSVLAFTPAFAQDTRSKKQTICNARTDTIEEVIRESPKDIEEKLKVSGFISTSFLTDDLSPSGSVAGEDLVNNTFVNLSIGNLSLYTWTDYNFRDRELHELDLGFSYKFPIKEIKDSCFKGNITGRFGFEHWGYPSGFFGSYDNTLRFGVNYSGLFDADIAYTHLLSHGDTESGDRAYLSIKKPIKVFEKNGVTCSLIPGIDTAILDNYYGVDGFGHVTPRLGLKLQKGDISAKLFVNRQFGNKDNPDITYGGIEFVYSHDFNWMVD